VHIGDFVWIASDVTVLRGVTIGDHSIVGTRSLVTRDVPPHTLAFGVPAEARGSVGDRSQAS
jgi:galactoside O-acetyltransferase